MIFWLFLSRSEVDSSHFWSVEFVKESSTAMSYPNDDVHTSGDYICWCINFTTTDLSVCEFFPLLLIGLWLSIRMIKVTILLIFSYEYVTIKIWIWFFIQKLHSVSTLDVVTLAHLGISYLASSSPSSWIIDPGASTHMTDKFTGFYFSHIFCPFYDFCWW